MMMKRILMTLAGATLLALLTAGQAMSDPYTDVGFRGWGPRFGVSSGPDAVHVGAHLDFGNFAEHVRFQPNIELGFGDHENVYAINAEAAYRFSSQWDTWTPYLGGGLGANIKRFEVADHTDSHSDLGVNLLGGIEKGLSNGDRFFLELKLSLNDVPDTKVTAGWTFYH